MACPLWAQDFCQVSFNSVCPDFWLGRNGKFTSGTPLDLIDFFKEHGSCAFCGSPVKEDFGKCLCGKPRTKGEHLVIKFSTEHYQRYKKIFDREHQRVRSTQRQAMIKKNGGAFHKKHIAGMHTAQRGLCYYCGTSIELGSKSLHADHHLPIAMGGRNDLDNMVLACAKCNLQKNSMEGARFDAIVRKFRSTEFSAILRAMRKDLREYRKKHRVGS
jgi:5-methylcytosine-specific restriction endonuclease McrA